MHLQGHYSESPATTPRAKSPETGRCRSTHMRGSSTQILIQQVQLGSAAQACRVPLPEESEELENHCGIHIQGGSVQSYGVSQRVHSEQLHPDPAQVTDNVSIKAPHAHQAPTTRSHSYWSGAHQAMHAHAPTSTCMPKPSALFEEIVADNFPNLGKETENQVQEGKSSKQEEPIQTHTKTYCN